MDQLASLFIIFMFIFFSICFSWVTRKRRHYPDNEDLISNLDDDTLLLILSRIPTRTAVTTSILSKRWRNLYKSLSSFDFKLYDLISNRNQCALLNYRLETFVRHCSGSKIHTLHGYFCFARSNDKRFKQVIYHLGNSGIEDLSICLSCKCRPTPFPWHLLSKLPSLNFLVLLFCSVRRNLNKQFYSLQSLRLVSCSIVTGSIECILSNCLSIQSLCIMWCQLPPKLCFRGPNLQLKELEIRGVGGVREIELYASNLSKFKFVNGDMMPHLVFDHVPQLETTYFFPKLENHNAHMMDFVFGGLAVHAPRIKTICFGTRDDFYQGSIRTFSCLKRLDIIVWPTPATDLLKLAPYLERCPVLEELYLDLAGECHGVAAKSNSAIAIHSNLRKARITGFAGTENEIKFALYVLKSAVALEEMWIFRTFEHRDVIVYKDDREPWKRRALKNIKRSLVGQARSATAKLFIHHQHQSCFPLRNESIFADLRRWMVNNLFFFLNVDLHVQFFLTY